MFRDEKVWRFLCAFWTIVFMAFVTVDFFMRHRFESLTTPMAAIYAGILTLYVGTKEFDRWYDLHDGRHPGEFFLTAWTVLMFIFFGFSLAAPNTYLIPPEVVASYIMVLTIFALTQKSKQLHRAKSERKLKRKK